MSLNKTQRGALALAASLMLGSSAWAQSSGGGGAAGGGAAGGAAGASGSAGTGSTSPGLSAGTGSSRGNNAAFGGSVGFSPGPGGLAGTGSTNPGLSAGTGSFRGNNAPANTTTATINTINGMLGANGAPLVNGTNLVGAPGLGTTQNFGVTPQNVLVAPGGAATGLSTGVPRATLRRNTARRFSTRNTVGAARTASRLNATNRNTTVGNAATANNLTALGFTGGRPVTLTGNLFDVQGFFNGASGVPALQGVPVLQGTPISTTTGAVGAANTGVAGTTRTDANNFGQSVVVVPTQSGQSLVTVPNRSGPGTVVSPGGTVTANGVVNPGTTRAGVGFPTGLNTGVTGTTVDNFGTAVVTPSNTLAGVSSTTGIGTPVQPGIDTGTELVGANQVGLTGNTLAATNPRAAVSGTVQSVTPLQAAPVFTNAGTASAMGNLMFLQTSTGPILVANASGVPLNPTMSNIQLQGQLFQRGPFRLLVLSDTGLGTTGIR